MSRGPSPGFGHRLPAPRLSALGAALLALVPALAGGAVLALLD